MKRRVFLISAAALLPQSVLAERPTPAQKLVAAALSQIGVTIAYNPAYEKLSYPNGDVPIERGVCTDVVIRAYRKGLAVDLQALVHEDMRQHFAAYPRTWGMKKPDRNIDHRRVPNLQRFFERRNSKLDAITFQPGDVVTIMLPGNLPHIGIVSETKNQTGERLLLIHNIGAGTQREDVLDRYPITGHYRFFPT
jgi:uncharacterized protein